jgi:hypothetical protein
MLITRKEDAMNETMRSAKQGLQREAAVGRTPLAGAFRSADRSALEREAAADLGALLAWPRKIRGDP